MFCLFSNAYEAVALGTAGVLIGDDDGLEDLAKLLEVAAHGVALGLPGEASHEDLGVGGVAATGIDVAATHLEVPWLRRHHNKTPTKTRENIGGMAHRLYVPLSLSILI